MQYLNDHSFHNHHFTQLQLCFQQKKLNLIKHICQVDGKNISPYDFHPLTLHKEMNRFLESIRIKILKIGIRKLYSPLQGPVIRVFKRNPLFVIFDLFQEIKSLCSSIFSIRTL